MADSADPILAYGYRIGGPDSGWKIKSEDPYWDPTELPWCNEEEDFIEQAEERLKNIPEALGVTFVGYGYKYSNRILGIVPADGLVQKGDGILDLHAMNDLPALCNWDAKLAIVLYDLGITPTQERAGWILEAACG